MRTWGREGGDEKQDLVVGRDGMLATVVEIEPYPFVFFAVVFVFVVRTQNRSSSVLFPAALITSFHAKDFSK